MLNPWFALTFKAMQIGFDAQNVIFLRMMRLSAGGARGQSEARRMVSEKIAAGVEAQAVAVSGMITGHKDTVVAGQFFGEYRNGFAPINADYLVSDAAQHSFPAWNVNGQLPVGSEG